MAFISAIPLSRRVSISASVCAHPPASLSSRRPPVATAQQDDEADTGTGTGACEGCGRPSGPAPGCDGTGRIIGGLGAVVKWWPIKAYRPCPDYLKTNKKYKRSGQSLDEIAFNRKSVDDDKSITERLSGK